ncbi:MAG TPA: prolyl oligopeptidase family serine peptidase, partial [Planctomycetota bacterium]|nr:prolyl oligopeptidase family serine peptidase [Planctomycetota bacterium]
GHRLAVARGSEVFVLDPPEPGGSWRVARIYGDPPAPREAPTADAAEPAQGDPEVESTGESKPPAVGPEAPPERLGRVRSIAFAEEDRTLRVSNGDEVFLFDLDGIPRALEDVRRPTAAIEAAASSLQWSRDQRVVFSPRGAVAWLELPPEEGGASTQETSGQPTSASATPEVQPSGAGLAPAPAPRRVAAQLYDLELGRAILLEGMAEMRWLEDAALSGDGRFVAAAEVDRSAQPAPALVPDFLTPRVSTREARRELANDVAPPRRLWMWDGSSGEKSEILLPELAGAWISDIGWSRPSEGEPARYALRRLSADFKRLELWCWSEGELERVFEERDERWVGGPGGRARWSPSDPILLVPSEAAEGSTTPGRCQLFAVDPRDGTARQLTEVEGELASFVAREDGSVVFTARGADPARRHVGWIPADVVRGERAGAPHWIAAPPGFDGSVEVASASARIVFSHEELGMPAELWCAETGSDAPARRLTRTVPDAYLAVDWIRPVKLTVEAADGTPVRAHVYLPRGTSLERPDRPRACVVFIHGAGYLQNVTDSMSEYEVNLLFHSRLAGQGYVVLDVDYRGSAGYGNRFRTDVQGHLGGKDLTDIEDAVDALAARGVIDPERVGCYGGSYGGFLTLMALFTSPERWSCGAALRSVTDWRTYSPGYTQPRLGRPSTHTEAYRRSSPIDHAAGLRAPLLLLHGMVDSNVFAQDTIRLMEELIRLGKDFDAMLYPSQGHGFEDGRAWVDEYRRIERFLTRHLGPP